MIINVLIDIAHGVLGAVLGLLPQGHLSLGGAASVAAVLSDVDSVIPIAGPLQVAVTILATIAVFVTVRFFLLVWNLIWP